MARREVTKPELAVVTERAGRQKHTQALAQLPNINPMPVLKCDAEGRVLFMNSAAESYLLGLGLSRDDATRIFPPQLPPADPDHPGEKDWAPGIPARV